MNKDNVNKRGLYLFAVFLVLYEFSTYSTNDMIMPGMLGVVKEFGGSLSVVGLSLSIYIFGSTILQLCMGPLSERCGKRRLIIVGSSIFMLATILLIFSFSIKSFLLLRLLQGSGLAFISVGYSLIHENFSDKDAIKLTTLMGNVSVLAPLIGPMIGSLIVSYLNWRFVYVVTAILAVTSIYGLYRYTPNHDFTPKPIKILEIIHNYKKVIINQNFRLGAMSISLLLVPSIAWIGLAPTMLIKRLHLSYLDYSLYQLLAIGGFSISGILMQFIAGKISFVKLLRAGNMLCVFGLCVFLFAFIAKDNLAKLTVVAAALLVYGFGCGLCNGTIIRLIVTEKSYSQNFAMALMIFNLTLVMVISLEILNRISFIFDYSLNAFVCGCLFFIVLGNIGIYRLANRYQTRSWE